MLRRLVGIVLVGALVSARAAADALPYDPATGTAIDGAAVVLDLEKYPDYTLVIVDGGCFSDRLAEDEMEARLRAKIGDERLGCGYRVVEPGVAYKGVSYEAPNAESDEFFALPAKRFPVKAGKVPALDAITFGTLVAWQDGAPDSPLVALGQPPGFVELHRFSERTGFTDVLRVSSPCGAPRLLPVRREWQLENGEVIVQAHADAAPRCDPSPAVPEDRLDGGRAAGEGAGAPATGVSATSGVQGSATRLEPRAVEPELQGVTGPVASSAGFVDMSGETAGARFGARELALGGVCLLVGLGSGLALRRRQAR